MINVVLQFVVKIVWGVIPDSEVLKPTFRVLLSNVADSVTIVPSVASDTLAVTFSPLASPVELTVMA